MAMAAQGLVMMSSCSSSLLACRPTSIQKCNSMSQFRARGVGAAMVLRWQPIRSFWCFPLCSSFRCGDLWRVKQSTTRMESSGASGSTFRAGPSPADKVEQRPTRQYNFDTIVLEPTGKHLATVVWLHGFSDSGARCLPCPVVTPSCANQSSQEFHQILVTFRCIQCMFYVPIHNLVSLVMCTDEFKFGGFRWATELKNVNQLSPNIRWIIPTASLARDMPVTAWFEFRMGQNADMEGLDRSAQRVVELLLDDMKRDGGGEKPKLVVGGFSQGCATALYITACSVIGKYGGNGKPFPVKLDAAIGLSGWMPTIKDLVAQMLGNRNGYARAKETAIFLGHCEDDGVVPAGLAKASAAAFQGVGFQDVTLKTYPKGGHAAPQEEIEDIRQWVTTKLQLERSTRTRSN